MACILTIETSTTVCSVALADGNEVIFDKIAFEGPSHAVLLGGYVEEAIAVMKKKDLHPDAVAVSSGPGSYTGLRIGVSLAKGLCFGFGIPLIGVPTLDLLAATATGRGGQPDGCVYCAMVDARRMEVYAALYKADLTVIRPAAADIVTAGTYASFLADGAVCFFGNGAAKCKTTIASPNALFLDDIYPSAVEMVPLAQAAYRNGRTEDTAYFEPFYLKEFQATVAKNKVLNEALSAHKPGR